MPVAPDAPGTATTSSVRPRASIAVPRMVWLIVSPVASEAAMIVVPSIRPRTISADRAAAAAGVPDAEPHQDGVAGGEDREGREGGRERDEQYDRERPRGDAEDLVHADAASAARGRSASRTS